MNVKENPVVRAGISFMFPVVALLSFYVQMHGEESPGGGFQAGALLASAFVVYILINAHGAFMDLMLKVTRVLASLGVAIYAVTGVIPIFGAGKYLEHGKILSLFFPEETAGNKLGVFVVELGVGLAVFAVFFMIALIFIKEVYVKSVK